MSKRSKYDADAVQAFLHSSLASAEPEADTLHLPNYDQELRSESETVLAYVRSTMAGRKESPLFQFCSSQNFSDLPAGAEKWLGFIPWFLTEASTRGFAETEADSLAETESTRLKLDETKVPQLRTLIRNALVAILHDNLKQARYVKAVNPDLGWKNKTVENPENDNFSYERLKQAVGEAIHESKDSNTDPMLILSEKLGLIDLDSNPDEKEKFVKKIEEAKLDAIALYENLGKEILEGQKEAGINGDYASIDLRIEDVWEPYFEYLKKAFGLNGAMSEDGKDEYEAQAIAHLTYLLLRLRSHPVMKTRERVGPGLNRKFIKNYYKRIGATAESKKSKQVGLAANGRLATDPSDIKNHAHLDCYQTNLEGFEDLAPETKEIVRGRFRLKDEISILIKTLIKKYSLKDITDLDAGECIAININERDLEEGSPNRERLAEFMKSLAREAVQSFGMDLKEIQGDMEYHKIPRGTYKIEDKLKMDPKNTESFNFPAMKAYMNIPIDDPKDPEASIRVEFRVLCGDTYLRGEHDTTSRSHHSFYKRKQAIKLLKVIPRAYNSQIHTVGNEYEAWAKKQEKGEMAAIRDRRRIQKDRPIIVDRTASPHSSSPASRALQGPHPLTPRVSRQPL